MESLRDIGEFGLIDRIAKLTPSNASVLEGIGDDCAVVQVGDRVIVISCDLTVEDIHFRRRYATAEEIGWKAAATAVSDIAAMGCKPKFMLCALSCPSETPLEFLDGLYFGIRGVTDKFDIAIVGGDTTKAVDRITLDVTVIGESAHGRYLMRNGAKEEDVLFSTGPLGLAKAGLHALENDLPVPETLREACLRPHPRVAEGLWLCARPEVHAMMDISDGLIQDAGHIARRSDVGVVLDPVDENMFAALVPYMDVLGLDGSTCFLQGGEDYELLFCVAPDCADALAFEYAKHFGDAPLRIGVCTKSGSGVMIKGGVPYLMGFDHFRE